jgi:hypothetical protein
VPLTVCDRPSLVASNVMVEMPSPMAMSAADHRQNALWPRRRHCNCMFLKRGWCDYCLGRCEKENAVQEPRVMMDTVGKESQVSQPALLGVSLRS